MLRIFETCSKNIWPLSEDFTVLSAVGICLHNCQLKNRDALGYIYGPSLDEEKIDFAKTLRASLFNEGLSATSTSRDSGFKETVSGILT